MERCLAAVVTADVVRYSRLIREGEEGTLARFQEFQNEIFQPRIADFGGRLVKTMSNSYLLEFPSAVTTVECCPPDKRVAFDGCKARVLQTGSDAIDVLAKARSECMTVRGYKYRP